MANLYQYLEKFIVSIANRFRACAYIMTHKKNLIGRSNNGTRVYKEVLGHAKLKKALEKNIITSASINSYKVEIYKSFNGFFRPFKTIVKSYIRNKRKNDGIEIMDTVRTKVINHTTNDIITKFKDKIYVEDKPFDIMPILFNTDKSYPAKPHSIVVKYTIPKFIYVEAETPAGKLVSMTKQGTTINPSTYESTPDIETLKLNGKTITRQELFKIFNI